MGKGNTWSANLLALLFQAVTVPNIAENASSTPIMNLYISLHTANPGATGTQLTFEAAYSGYARVPVARSTSGWVLTGQTISPAAQIQFPQATGGSEVETYFGIGTAATGAGVLLYSGILSPPVAVSNGIIPDITNATTINEA